MKFNNEHDEYLYEGSVESGVVDGNGEVQAPTGWFASITLDADADEEGERAALAHYGTPFLILHESNEGFVTVLTFKERAGRDSRATELDQAYGLWLADVQPEHAVEAITGYQQAQLFTATDEHGISLDGRGLSWSTDAQRAMKDDVLSFITNESIDIRDFLRVTGHGWTQVGIDFSLTRNGHGAGFWDRGAGDVGDRLTAATKPYGEQGVTLSESGELEVL